ncbi:MAG TPA: GatB/YqeY domain-containing protein, partial [Candidatus Binataceae bacterium]
EANEAEVIHLIKRERARREEALEFARKANRADLIAENETQSKMLAEYLPAELAPDEVRAAIGEIVTGGANQMGAVMKALRERFGAQLDGKLASEMVREALAKK